MAPDDGVTSDLALEASRRALEAAEAVPEPSAERGFVVATSLAGILHLGLRERLANG